MIRMAERLRQSALSRNACAAAGTARIFTMVTLAENKEAHFLWMIRGEDEVSPDGWKLPPRP
jgi:hypothetical protein